jgi:hypothetical protein
VCVFATALREKGRGNALADADVPDFAFGHEIFEFLPCRVGVVCEVLVEFVVGSFLEGDRPAKEGGMSVSVSVVHNMEGTNQWMRYRSKYVVPSLASESSRMGSMSSGA